MLAFNVRCRFVNPETNDVLIEVNNNFNRRDLVRQFAEKANEALRQGFKVETIAA